MIALCIMKAACFTAAVMDFFPQQKQFVAGGNALNQSVAFRHLGWDSAFLGAIGQDKAGHALEQLLADQGVDISHLHRLPGSTACNQIVNDEDGERHGVEGSWNGGVYSDFKLSEKDWEYLSGFDLWSTHVNGINYAQSLSRKMSHQKLVVDYMHFDTYEMFEMGIGAVDIAYFAGSENQIDDLVQLSRKAKGILVLTLGAKGSVAIQNGETFHQEALPIAQVIDTTGCGDAFQAGFTSHYFQTRDLRQALFAGAEMGCKAAQWHGGVSWATQGAPSHRPKQNPHPT
jgi:fructoselysine 6-kinase